MLKPAAEYGGRGIVFGHRSSPAEWSAALDRATADAAATHVCQDLLGDPWTYPAFDGQEWGDHEACLGPMFYRGRYAGTVLRQARHTGAGSIINVARGARAGALVTRTGDRRWTIDPGSVRN